MKLRDRVTWILKGIALALLFSTLFGLVVQWLWNHLCPDIFRLPPIGWLQAVGLVLLSRLLFGHPGGGKPRPFRREEGDPRCGIHGWRKYGAWWKAEGRRRFEAWSREESSGERPTQE